jgi:hypothetical protein
MSTAPSSNRAHGSRRRPDDHVIVLFGATGDPAKRSTTNKESTDRLGGRIDSEEVSHGTRIPQTTLPTRL